MRRNWQLPLGLGIVAVLLWWLFRDLDPARVWDEIRNANVLLLLLTTVVTMGAFFARAVRWRYFLAPAQPGSPLGSRLAGVCVGFMLNNLLPSGRVGELGRAYAYSRLEPVSISTAVATLVVERLLDGVAILALLVLAITGPGFPAEALPADLVAGIRLVTAFLGVVLVAAVLLVAFPGAAVRICGRVADRLLPDRLGAGVVGVIDGVVDGLASMRGWRHMLPALLWSFVVWTIQSLSFWIGFRAFGIDLPFAAAVVTNAAIAVAVTLPAAPGYLGTFQIGATLALVEIYGIGDEQALGFALGWHLVNFFPITLAGLWYTRRLGISLREFRSRGGEGEDSAGPGSPR